MTDKQTLLALAERVEKAEGADRELDAEIWAATDNGRAGRYSPAYLHSVGNSFADIGKYTDCPRFTASLDGAMTLIDPADEWSLTTIYNIARAEVGINRDQQTSWTGYGENACCIPVLALLAAALRARAGAMG